MGSLCGKAKQSKRRGCSEFLACEDNVEDLKHVVWRTAYCRHHLGTDKGDEKAGCKCFQKMSFLANITSHILQGNFDEMFDF